MLKKVVLLFFDPQTLDSSLCALFWPTNTRITKKGRWPGLIFF